MKDKTLHGIFLKLPIPAISKFEFCVCTIIVFGITLYSGYEASKASQEFIRRYENVTDFEERKAEFLTIGIFGSKDGTDFEWGFWEKITLSWIVFASLYVVIGFVLQDRIPEKLLRVTRLLVAWSALSYWCGVPAVVAFILNVLLAYFAAARLRNLKLVWALNIATVATLNNDKMYVKFQLSILQFWVTPGTNHEWEQYVMSLNMFLYAMLVLRYTSAGMSCVKGSVSLLDFLYYCFYLPCLCTGPLQTWDEFTSQMACRPPLKERLRSAAPLAVRVFAWLLASELLLHLIYIRLIANSAWFMEELNLWALFGIGCYNGIFFQTKYFVMFGLPGVMGRLDGMMPWEPPKCIMWIYHYSAMWKCFDCGLYEILKTVIYIPLGGARHGLLRQFLAAAVTFSYIAFWHGGTWVVFIWCLLDYIGIQFESIFRYLEKQPPLSSIKERLSPTWWRRLYCLANSVLWMYYVFAIFLFFCGEESGRIYFKRFVTDASLKVWLVVFLQFYCGVQFSVSYQRWVLLKHQSSMQDSTPGAAKEGSIGAHEKKKK